ncbi:hypothetical protein BDA96_05G031900 [Sorghum bicolor]|uniref:Uncharacterized protein n=1 Tax=Sorghum bicolor TaxID=4558 RepID=A0A921UFI7_SORBI|nr:hypothetical protein BDA96_05G031900 [Sorghum bicolor]
MVPVLYPAVAASSSLPFAFQLLTIIHRRGETSGRLPSPHRLPRTPIHGSPLPLRLPLPRPGTPMPTTPSTTLCRPASPRLPLPHRHSPL